MTLRQEIIDGLMRGGMSQQEASGLVKRLCQEYESKGWSRGHDDGYDDGMNEYM